MRIVIFAGGVGTRMWPLSRKSTPKQFEKIVGDKSTLQLAVERVRPEVDYRNIYISTGAQYVETVRTQLPELPPENVIGEPEMRDVGPAVGYLMSILAKNDPWMPVAILWSDHLVEHVDRFKAALSAGAEYIENNRNVFVFIGQKARFPNQNLGWIEHSDKITEINQIELHKFVSWHYRPDLETAEKYYQSPNYSWNPGYFILAPQFVLDQYKTHAPEMYAGLIKLQQSYGKPDHQKILTEIYPKLEKISFDDAVVTKTEPEKAVVLTTDLGWSDIGTWEALKEALQKTPTENIINGNVTTYETNNTVVYNFTDQLVSTIGLENMVVVATPDVIMVAPQAKIPQIKKLLETFVGTPNEKYA
jgi:mannose-1-phosphate guanylyltransferase